MKTRLSIVSGVIVAALAAAPASAGHGGNAASHYTPQALKALGQQWEAKATFYGKRSLSLNDDRPAASFYTPRALRAMGKRGEAMVRHYSPPAASFYTPQALQALGERGEAMTRFYASQPQLQRTTSSFDWAAADAGAVGAIGLVLLVAAGVSIRTRRVAKPALQ